MSDPSPDLRRKIAGILARLSSDQVGEVVAAAHLATTLLAKHGLSWAELLVSQPVEKQLPELGTWRTTCRTLLKHPAELRAWEISFLTDLPKFRRLSTKQRYVLKEIRDRVLGGGQ